mmetsp:Transcript_57114/g.185630  ORF Transcript_57114/g.185630 Transcript_57114/m.185630 type:complete len:366 (+) Transcript_57114:3976-5073(+)
MCSDAKHDATVSWQLVNSSHPHRLPVSSNCDLVGLIHGRPLDTILNDFCRYGIPLQHGRLRENPGNAELGPMQMQIRAAGIGLHTSEHPSMQVVCTFSFLQLHPAALLPAHDPIPQGQPARLRCERGRSSPRHHLCSCHGVLQGCRIQLRHELRPRIGQCARSGSLGVRRHNCVGNPGSFLGGIFGNRRPWQLGCNRVLSPFILPDGLVVRNHASIVFDEGQPDRPDGFAIGCRQISVEPRALLPKRARDCADSDVGPLKVKSSGVGDKDLILQVLGTIHPSANLVPRRLERSEASLFSASLRCSFGRLASRSALPVLLQPSLGEFRRHVGSGDEEPPKARGLPVHEDPCCRNKALASWLLRCRS